ncbi:putative dehydrogenase [Evansella vedderi]|uniref:Dehydrogenase n=1 Tax=Evansella vedderi TaxID=38282 RepID=A0ABT9ZPE2_9BACI|nr:Gfo/Idh/MocA family oxidoreductase [Evansella vedderi]MDQ0253069.1 putative dehydrogenase [Evansella vedderi]
MDKKVRWGILSTANIGRKAIIPALQNVPNVEVAAVASASDKVEAFAEALGISQIYRSYEELLEDTSIDAVYIPLPNTLHKEWVLKAAAKGKHVLCEKPAALTAEDVQEMVDGCRENGVIFMEAFMYQFQPQHQRVKEIISSGEIGEVRHMRSTFTFKLNFEEQRENIRLNGELGGGSIWDVGCYCIHSSRLILGEEPTEVYVTGKIHPDFQVDTNAAGILTFPSGVTAMIHSSFEEPMDDNYEIFGTKGSIYVPFAYRPDRLESGLAQVIVKNETGEERTETFKGNQYELQVEHFSNCVLNGEEPSYTGEQTLNNIKTIQACYQSLHSKKPVQI